tara:strand:+ start:280 stop:705 length:426 start_codon:yes stop_codon:yes gene_type:complete
MRTSRLLLTFAVAATLGLAGCRATVPVNNIVNTSYGSAAYADAKNLTLTDYEKAIVRATTYRNWVAKPLAPGHIEASNLIRNKHKVVVDILFDTETFSIKYKDSTHLAWNPTTQTIHPNYNSWVRLLEADIKSEIQRLRAS